MGNARKMEMPEGFCRAVFGRGAVVSDKPERRGRPKICKLDGLRVHDGIFVKRADYEARNGRSSIDKMVANIKAACYRHEGKFRVFYFPKWKGVMAVKIGEVR
jgi:hypothetical protein